jgi:hypothetical protein
MKCISSPICLAANVSGEGNIRNNVSCQGNNIWNVSGEGIGIGMV